MQNIIVENIAHLLEQADVLLNTRPTSWQGTAAYHFQNHIPSLSAAKTQIDKLRYLLAAF